MTTQPPVTEEPTPTPVADPAPASSPARPSKAPKAPRQPIGQTLRALNWRLLLVVGVGVGILWIALFATSITFSVFASFLPVLAGLLVGRRVQQHVAWHGAMLSVIATLAALAGWAVAFAIQGPTQLLIQALSLILITLLPFTGLGVVISARSEQRARAVREEVQRRGGRLDRPGRVRTLNDLQALSLPQLGGYVADLFRKHGFTITEYRIEKDRDRIDFDVVYEGTPWLMRVTTADNVKPGIVQELAQRMKATNVTKGVAITSMRFQEPAVRWAKGKPVALIDGETLLSMDD